MLVVGLVHVEGVVAEREIRRYSHALEISLRRATSVQVGLGHVLHVHLGIFLASVLGSFFFLSLVARQGRSLLARRERWPRAMASRPLTTVHASKSVGRPKPRHAADPAPGWWPDPGLLIADLSLVLFVLLRRVTAAPHVETCFQQTNAVE